MLIAMNRASRSRTTQRRRSRLMRSWRMRSAIGTFSSPNTNATAAIAEADLRLRGGLFDLEDVGRQEPGFFGRGLGEERGGDEKAEQQETVHGSAPCY